MKALDISKPVETREGRPVRGLHLRTEGRFEAAVSGFASDYPLAGDVVTPNAGIVTCSWTADGRHLDNEMDSPLDLHNVIENPNEIDWNKPGILDELQYHSGRSHNFTRVLAVDKEGKYPVVLMHKGGSFLSHFTKKGEAPFRSEDLVRKPVKVTRTLYFAKEHIDALAKGKSQYLIQSHGDVAVKVEYTI